MLRTRAEWLRLGVQRWVAAALAVLTFVGLVGLLIPGVADAALRGASQGKQALMVMLGGKLIPINDSIVPVRPTTVVTPVTSMLPNGIRVDNDALPKGKATGFSTYRVGPGNNPLPSDASGLPGPYCDGVIPCSHNDDGDFRDPCDFSHFAYDDPIVYPNQPGKSHLHTFFGNTQTTGLTTVTSIRTEGNSTCAGGWFNKSGYWVPSVVDKKTGRVKVPAGNLVYYKAGFDDAAHNALITAPVIGLRIIACSPTNVVPCDAVVWACNGSNLTHHGMPSSAECPDGTLRDVTFSVTFPRCSDGVNLDGNPAIPGDHASHMRYTLGNQDCPAGFPVRIPNITFTIHYQFTADEHIEDWALSSDTPTGIRGASAHGDWFNGWNRGGDGAPGGEDMMDTIVRTCLHQFVNCHAYGVGPFKAGDTGETQWRLLY